MKMGMSIYKGEEAEVKKEFQKLLEKARTGFENQIIENDNEFIIVKSDIRISFSVDKLFQEYAIYQIIN